MIGAQTNIRVMSFMVLEKLLLLKYVFIAVAKSDGCESFSIFGEMSFEIG